MDVHIKEDECCSRTHCAPLSLHMTDGVLTGMTARTHGNATDNDHGLGLRKGSGHSTPSLRRRRRSCLLLREGLVTFESVRQCRGRSATDSVLRKKCDIRSTGRGKMMVEFFSALMLVKVWRKRSCVAKRVELGGEEARNFTK